MKRNRVDEYHKNGCHFFGKLVVISYEEDMKRDKRWGTFAAGISIDYMLKAKAIADERYPNHTVLLSMPEYVIRIEEELVAQEDSRF